MDLKLVPFGELTMSASLLGDESEVLTWNQFPVNEVFIHDHIRPVLEHQLFQSWNGKVGGGFATGYASSTESGMASTVRWSFSAYSHWTRRFVSSSNLN